MNQIISFLSCLSYCSCLSVLLFSLLISLQSLSKPPPGMTIKTMKLLWYGRWLWSWSSASSHSCAFIKNLVFCFICIPTYFLANLLGVVWEGGLSLDSSSILFFRVFECTDTQPKTLRIVGSVVRLPTFLFIGSYITTRHFFDIHQFRFTVLTTQIGRTSAKPLPRTYER